VKLQKDRTLGLSGLLALFHEKTGGILPAWLLYFEQRYGKEIDLDEFMAGMKKLEYTGDAENLFRKLDLDESEELTLEEIDDRSAKLWMRFRFWAVKTFEDEEDMLKSLGEEAGVDDRDSFLDTMRDLYWEEGQEDILYRALCIFSPSGNVVTKQALAWFAIDKKKCQKALKVKEQAAQERQWKTKEKREIARAIKDFKAFLKKKFGTFLRAWRCALDLDGSMFIQKNELFKAVKEIAWPGDARMVWRGLDKDGSGVTSLQEIDLKSAEQLAKLKQQMTDRFGSTGEAFKAFDVLRAGKLKAPEFIEKCKEYGFVKVNKALFHGLDSQGNKFLTKDSLKFLDSWRCPRFLTCEANPKAAADFKAALLREFPNYVKAWRLLLDRDNSNCIAWEEFEAAAKQMNYVGDVAGAWRSFDEDISGTITLREIDQPSFDRLNEFKTWCDAEFGNVKGAFQMLDTDNSGDFDKREWAKSLVYFGFQGDCRGLFKVLDTDGEGLVSMDEVAFLDQWEEAEEDEPAPDPETAHSNAGVARKRKLKIKLSPRLERLATSKPTPRPNLPVIPATQYGSFEQPSRPDMMRSTYGRFPSLAKQKDAEPMSSSTIEAAPARYARQMRFAELKEEILAQDINEFAHTEAFGLNLADIKQKTHRLRERTVDLFNKAEIYEGNSFSSKGIHKQGLPFVLPRV